MSGTNLKETVFRRANLTGVNFESAVLVRTNFNMTNINTAALEEAAYIHLVQLPGNKIYSR